MNILFIGDIIGKPGRQVIKNHLADIKSQHKIDFTIANVENSAGGAGITAKIYDELLRYGIDLMTAGNHLFDKPEIYDFIGNASKLCRPFNTTGRYPGNDFVVEKAHNGVRIGAINPLGFTFMKNTVSPFDKTKQLISTIKNDADVLIVDFHAEVTSEKMAMGWFLDGTVSAVFGTHTHIQTSDERILPLGTAYLTDVGMTGPYDSIIGVKKELAFKRFLENQKVPFKPATNDKRFAGVIIGVDDKTFKVTSIERIFQKADNE